MATARKESRTSDRAQATRSHIMQTYLRLMLHRDWNRISVKELCAEAAVTRGTFYQYFDSMIDLMENIENETITEIQAVLNNATLEFKPQRVLYATDFDRDYNNVPSEYSLQWFKYCEANATKLLAMMNREHGDVLFIDRIRQIISKALAHSMNYEGLPNDAFRHQFLTLYTDMYINAVFSWIKDGYRDKLSARDMAVVVDSIRTGGLYTARRDRMEDLSKSRK